VTVPWIVFCWRKLCLAPLLLRGGGCGRRGGGCGWRGGSPLARRGDDDGAGRGGGVGVGGDVVDGVGRRVGGVDDDVAGGRAVHRRRLRKSHRVRLRVVGSA